MTSVNPRLPKGTAKRLNQLMRGKLVKTANGPLGRVQSITRASIDLMILETARVKSYPLFESFSNHKIWFTDSKLQDQMMTAIERRLAVISSPSKDRNTPETAIPAPAKPAAPAPKDIHPEDIDVATNVRVVCFFRGIVPEQYLYHMALLGLEGFDTSIEEGFSGKHAFFALRESARILRCSTTTLLSTQEELVQTFLKDCKPEKGWSWTEAAEDTTDDLFQCCSITCEHTGDKRSISIQTFFKIDEGRQCLLMFCKLFTPDKDEDTMRPISFGATNPGEDTVEQFEAVYRKLAPAPGKPGKPVAAAPSPTPSPTQKPTEKPKPQVRPIRVNEFLVRRSYGAHRKNGHSLEPIRATVSILPRYGGDVRAVEFDAFWCPKCRKYYMTEATFESLKRKGYICCKVIEEKDLDADRTKGSGFYGNLAQESILHMYGYTVSQQAGLSQEERRDIISFVIENKIQGPQDIAHLLEWLIASHERNPRMDVAVSKWEDDLSFVRRYRKPTRKVRVDAIYARR